MTRWLLPLIFLVPLSAVQAAPQTMPYRLAPAQCGPGGCPVQIPPMQAPSAPARSGPMAATVRVVVVRTGASGSGVCVFNERGYGVVITCRHVVDGLTPGKIATTEAESVQVRFPSGYNAWAILLGTDSQADLAALGVSTTAGTPSVPISATQLQAGESVQQVGYPAGRGPNYRQGQFRGFEAGPFTRWQQTASASYSFVIQPGDSGGGAFNSRGELVGITWGRPVGVRVASSNAVAQADLQRFAPTCWPPWKRNQPPTGQPLAPPTPPVAAPGPMPPAPPSLLPPIVPLAPIGGAIGVIEEIKTLYDLLHRLRTDVEDLRQIVGKQAGLPGPAGPAGPVGPSGPAGDAASLKIEISSLRAEVDTLRKTLSGLSGSMRIKVAPKP